MTDHPPMELYGRTSRSIPQKIWVLACEVVLLIVAYRILFDQLGNTIFGWFGAVPAGGDPVRNVVCFAFSLIVFVRVTFMMLVLLQRHMPLDEAISVPIAFSLYYVGYALLTIARAGSFGVVDVVGEVLFAVGSFLNTASEVGRHRFKADPSNRGKLYTSGLFALSMHINYFGDLLWVAGYALVSHNVWSTLIVGFLFVFFVFFNIPKLDKYLAEHYGPQFDEYAQHTKRFIPFVY